MLLRAKLTEHPDPIGDFVLEVARKIDKSDYLILGRDGRKLDHLSVTLSNLCQTDMAFNALAAMIREEFEKKFEVEKVVKELL